MKCFFVFILLCSLSSICCKDGGVAVQGDLLGTYTYNGYDEGGTLIIRGTLVFSREDSIVAGTWSFNDGRSGNLEGRTDNGSIYIDLNPGFVDNNLLLNGTFAGTMISGQWEQIGFPGVMAQGTFTAVRR